jgi:hypothetical protein
MYLVLDNIIAGFKNLNAQAHDVYCAYIYEKALIFVRIGVCT